MPLYKFGANDIFYNRIRTYPSSSFYIRSGSIFYQDRSTEIGQISGKMVPNATKINDPPIEIAGTARGEPLNLFELNIDRNSAGGSSRVIGPSSSVAAENVIDTGEIYKFIYKGSENLAPKQYTRDQFNLEPKGTVLIDKRSTGKAFSTSATPTRRFYLRSIS